MGCQVQALRAIEPHLGLEKLYVMGTNCVDNGQRAGLDKFLQAASATPETALHYEFMQVGAGGACWWGLLVLSWAQAVHEGESMQSRDAGGAAGQWIAMLHCGSWWRAVGLQRSVRLCSLMPPCSRYWQYLRPPAAAHPAACRPLHPPAPPHPPPAGLPRAHKAHGRTL